MFTISILENFSTAFFILEIGFPKYFNGNIIGKNNIIQCGAPQL